MHLRSKIKEVISWLFALCVALGCTLLGSKTAGAQEIVRPTVQDRVGAKTDLIYAHALGMTHVRNDFYNSLGLGIDLGYFLNESWGIEARGALLRTRLSDAALDVKARTGLTPDARPQDQWLLAGVRYALGYGKMLVWDRFVIHFDPQIQVLGGVAMAEAQTLPMVQTSFSAWMHFDWGIDVKLDFGVSIQAEERERGWIWTTGFAPVIGVGWGYSL